MDEALQIANANRIADDLEKHDESIQKAAVALQLKVELRRDVVSEAVDDEVKKSIDVLKGCINPHSSEDIPNYPSKLEAFLESAVQVSKTLQFFKSEVALHNRVHDSQVVESLEGLQRTIDSRAQSEYNSWVRLDLVKRMQEWMLPSKLVLYDEKEIIRESAFTNMYKGTYLGKPVTVECLQGVQNTDSYDLEHDIAREIKRWLKVSPFPFVSKLIGVCTKISKPLIVSEWHPYTIDSYLEDHPTRLLPLIYELICGIASIHEAGVLHGDLTPLNVLVSAEHHIKIADFSLSKSANTALSRKGSKNPYDSIFNWTSPEMLFQARRAGAPADIWSFGMIFCQLLTKEIPYRGQTVFEIEKALSGDSDRPKRPANLNPELFPLWKQLKWCWSRDPMKRPTAQELKAFMENKYNANTKNTATGSLIIHIHSAVQLPKTVSFDKQASFVEIIFNGQSKQTPTSAQGDGILFWDSFLYVTANSNFDVNEEIEIRVSTTHGNTNQVMASTKRAISQLLEASRQNHNVINPSYNIGLPLHPKGRIFLDAFIVGEDKSLQGRVIMKSICAIKSEENQSRFKNTVCILGSLGSGKSTLANSILGQYKCKTDLWGGCTKEFELLDRALDLSLVDTPSYMIGGAKTTFQRILLDCRVAVIVFENNVSEISEVAKMAHAAHCELIFVRNKRELLQPDSQDDNFQKFVDSILQQDYNDINALLGQSTAVNFFIDARAVYKARLQGGKLVNKAIRDSWLSMLYAIRKANGNPMDEAELRDIEKLIPTKQNTSIIPQRATPAQPTLGPLGHDLPVISNEPAKFDTRPEHDPSIADRSTSQLEPSYIQMDESGLGHVENEIPTEQSTFVVAPATKIPISVHPTLEPFGSDPPIISDEDATLDRRLVFDNEISSPTTSHSERPHNDANLPITDMVAVTLGYVLQLLSKYPRLGTMTTREVVHSFIKPLTKSSDSDCGLSLVDHLIETKQHHFLNRPKWLVSHTWHYTFGEVIDAIQYFLQEQVGEAAAPSVAFWFCAFNINQHKKKEQTVGYFLEQFASNLKSIRQMVMVMSPWKNPVTLQRLWCLFELYTAQKHGFHFDVAMSKNDKQQFLDEVRNDSSVFMQMMGSINSEKSITERTRDREEIIQAMGGRDVFRLLDRMAINTLQNWLDFILQQDIAKRHETRGHLRLDCGCMAQSIGEFNKAREIHGSVAPPGLSCRMLWRLEVACSYAEMMKGDPVPNWLNTLETRLSQQIELLGDDHIDTILTRFYIGSMFNLVGNSCLALKWLKHCNLQAQLHPDLIYHPRLLRIMIECAKARYNCGHYHEAVQLMENSMSLRTKIAPDHPFFSESTILFAVYQHDFGAFSVAESTLEPAWANLERTLPERHPALLDAQLLLCSIYQRLGKVTAWHQIMKATEKTPHTKNQFIQRLLCWVDICWGHVDAFKVQLTRAYNLAFEISNGTHHFLKDIIWRIYIVGLITHGYESPRDVAELEAQLNASNFQDAFNCYGCRNRMSGPLYYCDACPSFSSQYCEACEPAARECGHQNSLKCVLPPRQFIQNRRGCDHTTLEAISRDIDHIEIEEAKIDNRYKSPDESQKSQSDGIPAPYFAINDNGSSTNRQMFLPSPSSSHVAPKAS
ncbi:Kinesin light chain 3 [Aphanomyces cochlioides]|nr:Kinesin light chain 3 [Aphanomyces cochlioides]